MFNKETHLTEKQLEVFKRRKKGESLSEIAEDMNTSKSNVSHILKDAKKNIEKSENTLKLIRTLDWPIEIEVEPGTDLYDVLDEIFQKADEKNIHLSYSGPELVEVMGRKGNKLVRGRKVLSLLNVKISRDGEVEVLA